eukprot:TRINITY_DN9383_c0_g1_i1.p1 TRINITY_DN9383_c0_g1~~TRINITY_DN9383_c0_g1_i1.p1  ORF type:complete len:257 (-),score=31.77 TRINITY_DN9383_c0_g1_i1:202-972(-)
MAEHQMADSASNLGEYVPCEIPMPRFVRKQAKQKREHDVVSNECFLNCGNCPTTYASTYPFDVGAIAGLPIEWQGKTSVLVKNVPYRFSREMFEAELRIAGFVDTYDYLFLPVDRFRKTKNKGYAFLNFVNDYVAYRFKCTFDSHFFRLSWNPSKQLMVTPANLQGLTDNVAHCELTKAAKQTVALDLHEGLAPSSSLDVAIIALEARQLFERNSCGQTPSNVVCPLEEASSCPTYGDDVDSSFHSCHTCEAPCLS